MTKPTRLQIGDGGVREDDLVGGESARRLAGQAGGGAEERDLESPPLHAGVERASHVPPFDAGVVVRAEVAWEAEG